MSPTEEYIKRLSQLKSGDLGLLRTHALQGLDNSVEGFDLFAGSWWPLRAKNEKAPRRGVAWLIAKLYACNPIPHGAGKTLARQLGLAQAKEGGARKRFQSRFDRMLMLSLEQIEPALREMLDVIADHGNEIDWVRLTDDLSAWEKQSTRLRWARNFLYAREGEPSC